MPAPDPRPPPLVVTADAELLDHILRLCAATSITPDVSRDATSARRHWRDASLVLVGADCAAGLAASVTRRRRDVLLVAESPEPPAVWRHAMALGAEQVVVLPDAEQWLVERLADAADGNRTHGTVIGVMPARGGAGATTLAVGLAATAARRAIDVVLVDGDPTGGGIDLVVGCEDEPGLRWSEVAEIRGRVSAADLRSALPQFEGLRVLSWGREAHSVEPATMTPILAACRRAADLVVVDLPHWRDPQAIETLPLVDTTLLVCPSDVRSVAMARLAVRGLGGLAPEVRIVVRELTDSPLLAEEVAATLGVGLAGVIPSRRGIGALVDSGLGPLADGRFAAQCRRMMEELGVSERANR